MRHKKLVKGVFETGCGTKTYVGALASRTFSRRLWSSFGAELNVLRDRVRIGGPTGRQYGGPEHQGKAIGKATEELDRRPLLVRIGSV